MTMSVAAKYRRRDAVSASISAVANRVKECESDIHHESTLILAQQAKEKLDKLTSEFKNHHYNLLDAIQEGDLAKEQETLDNHDEVLANLEIRIKKIIDFWNQPDTNAAHKVVIRRLGHLIRVPVMPMDEESVDTHLLEQHQEELLDHKHELADVRRSLLALDVGEDGEANVIMTEVEKALFDCSLKIKKTLPPVTTMPSTSKGVRLPKLEVPTFDRNILNWTTFWEQFSVVVHSRSGISNAEKLVYLQHERICEASH